MLPEPEQRRVVMALVPVRPRAGSSRRRRDSVVAPEGGGAGGGATRPGVVVVVAAVVAEVAVVVVVVLVLLALAQFAALLQCSPLGVLRLGKHHTVRTVAEQLSAARRRALPPASHPRYRPSAGRAAFVGGLQQHPP